MSDAKTPYSKAAQYYVKEVVPKSEADQKRFAAGKAREARFNNQWIALAVNIDEVVDKYAPNAKQRVDRYKYIWSGEDYAIIADMITGTVRLYSRAAKMYTDRYGVPIEGNELTHFKILKRKDM